MKKKDVPIIEIVGLGNYYGCLSVRRLPDGKCEWSIENYNGHHWKPISKRLYMALLDHNKEQEEKP